ncbi:phage portal protein [Rhizobium sp. 2MFCol3.1]|uniref:phage portal protein n=1 Tax=Rhizobium sp. 2MFCol3.1 TaxID=1246459 RepID=UPI0003823CDD|nr:anti-CBASS Acb1 family protein [Rhizobium sp. 2MFCol3.1]
MFLFDRLQNLISGLGTSKDKTVGNAFVFTPIDPQQLIAMHRSDWMGRKVVDIIPDDMTREWREWKADEAVVEAIEKVERLPQINIQAKVNEALQLARLRGGALLVIGVDSGAPDEELVLERVGKDALKYVHVLGRDQVSYTEINRDITSPYFGEPVMWEFTSNTGSRVQIHPSRVVRFIGAPILDKNASPDEIWGDSVLQIVYDAVQNAASSQGHAAALLPEAKTDVLYVPNLSEYLKNPKTTQQLTERFAYANTMKSMFNMLLLEGNGGDGENAKGERWEQKTINLSQYPELLRQYLQVAAGAADIPLVRFLQDAPSGLGSNGEITLKNYYDKVSADQRNKLSPSLWRFDEIVIRSATGKRDAAIYYEWAPLYTMTEKERAEVFKAYADGARQLVGTASGQEIITREAVSKALINRIVEDGNLPGLAEAVEEFGPIEEQEPSEEELAAAAATQAANNNNVTRMQQAANDAAPRTLYVRRDVLNRADILAWAKEQGFTDVVPDLHVTVIHSRTPVDWFEMGESWSPRLEISAGGPRQMEAFGQDGNYYALLIVANELKWRHQAMVELGASWDWPEYQPHITIQVGGDVDLTKVTPYQGKIILGPEIFEELRED